MAIVTVPWAHCQNLQFAIKRARENIREENDAHVSLPPFHDYETWILCAMFRTLSVDVGSIDLENAGDPLRGRARHVLPYPIRVDSERAA